MTKTCDCLRIVPRVARAGKGKRVKERLYGSLAAWRNHRESEPERGRPEVRRQRHESAPMERENDERNENNKRKQITLCNTENL
eukprot:469198-Hanusia_phi.AAC.1